MNRDAAQAVVYEVRPLKDKAVLRRYLSQDRVLHAYALGDLEEELWPLSDFSGAYAGEALAGVSLVWRGMTPPVYLLFGSPEPAAALLGAPDIPDTVFGILPAELLDTFQVRFSPGETERLWRMAATPDEFIEGPTNPRLRRLRSADADALTRLMATERQIFDRRPVYHPAQLEAGVFFGIEDANGQLVAAAGTHIVALNERVGAIGHVFTERNARGRGYATATTGAVTRELFRQGIDLAALNVVQGNSPAIRAYQKLGYRIHAPLIECNAVKHAPETM
jgi:RimJ/RimL family protein N-acetyltransferase